MLFRSFVHDAVIQLSVKDRDLTAPPGSPVHGDRYLVKATATGAWAGQDGKFAFYYNTAWKFLAVKEGWLLWVDDENKLFVYNGTTYSEVATSGGVKHRPSITIEKPTANDNLSWFYTDVAITMQEIAAVLRAPTTGSPSVTWTIRFASTRNATGTEMKTGGTTTTTLSGSLITSWDDNTIPALSYIWAEITASNLTTGESLGLGGRYTED